MLLYCSIVKTIMLYVVEPNGSHKQFRNTIKYTTFHKRSVTSNFTHISITISQRDNETTILVNKTIILNHSTILSFCRTHYTALLSVECILQLNLFYQDTPILGHPRTFSGVPKVALVYKTSTSENEDTSIIRTLVYDQSQWCPH